MTQTAIEAGFLSLVDSFLSGERVSLFDEVARAAADSLGAPSGLVTILTPQGGVIRGSYRWPARIQPLQFAMARWVEKLGASLVVEDLAVDERFLTNPVVTNPPKARLYAGAPISIGQKVAGVLEVFGPSPLSITSPQRALLELLATQVSRQLDLWWRVTAIENSTIALEERMEDLRDSRDRLLDFFDSTTDLIMTILPGGRIINANAAFANMLGFAREDADVVLISDLVLAEVREEFARIFGEVVATGQSRRVETEFATRGGPRLIVDGTLIPKLHEGRAEIVRVIFRDITVRRLAEQELAGARDEALQAARAKSRFLANISHEIRTPIHVIEGMMELLLAGDLTRDQKELASTARNAADSLLHVFNNILHVSRMESGGLRPAVVEFDLRNNVDRLLEVMAVAGAEKNLGVKLTLDPLLPATLHGDIARLRQVLTNLVSNAVKFSDRGIIRVSVHLERETSTHHLVRFEVLDEGRGIPAESLPMIFQPFHQADTSSTRDQAGVGVGLSLSHQLVEVMGGVLAVTSAPGEGSRFWFTLPFEKRDSAQVAMTFGKSGLGSINAIVLNPNEASRRILTYYLGRWGVRSRTLDRADQVLQQLRVDSEAGNPCQLLICDWQPVADAMALSRKVRADHGGSTQFLLLVSSMLQVDDASLREAGVGAVLEKPVNESELFDVLSRLVVGRSGVPAARAAEGNGPAPEALTAFRSGTLRVLVAEDRPLNQKLMARQLGGLGLTADFASTGLEAVKRQAEAPYDVIFMDCQMPIMDGYDATVEIRKTSGERSRIIAMTANALESDREKCLAAGMNDYIAKPASRADIEASLARCFSVPALSLSRSS